MTDQKIKDLHAAYVSLSRMDVALRFNRESAWMEFIRAGFTVDDLKAVLQRLVRLVEQGERRPEALKFSNVVEGLDRFEEELAMIKAEANGLKVGERQMNIGELRNLIEIKQSQADRLEAEWCFRDNLSDTWLDAKARTQWMMLRSEIRGLRDQMASLA